MTQSFPLVCTEILGRIGLHVKHKRLGAKLRQCDLAQRIGVSTPTIGRVEAGESAVELGTFIQVLAQLDMLDEVFRRLEAPPTVELPRRVRLKKTAQAS